MMITDDDYDDDDDGDDNDNDNDNTHFFKICFASKYIALTSIAQTFSIFCSNHDHNMVFGSF